ncbi:MAG: DNA repair protein RadC [Bdellovibrionota bacterium]
MKAVQEIPVEDRPRERIATRGAESLSDTELLAVILGSGSKQYGVHKLAANVLKTYSKLNGETSYKDLKDIPGIGPAKAALLSASLEFARRQIRPAGFKVSDASDIFALVRHVANRKQEHFICISLNGAHEVIATRVVTIGLVNSSQIHPREVFSDPILDRAASIIVAHNHPSGSLNPSQADIEVTKRLKKSGEILGIKVLDHVIFSERGFLSLQEVGRF